MTKYPSFTTIFTLDDVMSLKVGNVEFDSSCRNSFLSQHLSRYLSLYSMFGLELQFFVKSFDLMQSNHFSHTIRFSFNSSCQLLHLQPTLVTCYQPFCFLLVDTHKAFIVHPRQLRKKRLSIFVGILV